MGKACVFCEIVANPTMDVHEVGKLGVYHFEPLDPVVPGHRLFVPREHAANARTSSGITGLVFTAASTYSQSMDEDYNLIVNCGPNASQTIEHLHVHYIPRYENDGLLLPWTMQKYRCSYIFKDGGQCESTKLNHQIHWKNGSKPNEVVLYSEDEDEIDTVLNQRGRLNLG